MPRDWPGNRAPETLPDYAWERLPHEPPTAYHWFALYRDMDPRDRSMAKLAEREGRKTHMLVQWSTRWKWVERCERFDEFMEEQHRIAQIEYVQTAGRQRAELVVHTFDLLLARLTGRPATTDPETGETLHPGVAAIDPSMLDAKDLATLGNMVDKLARSAEEQAGVRTLDEQKVDVRLSFDLDGPKGEGHRVIEGLAGGASRELPRGEPTDGGTSGATDTGAVPDHAEKPGPP